MRELIPVFDRSEYPAVNELLKRKARPCPACAASQAALCFMSENRIIAPRHVVFCTRCSHIGLPAHMLRFALWLWNCSRRVRKHEWGVA